MGGPCLMGGPKDGASMTGISKDGGLCLMGGLCVCRRT